MYDEDEKEYFLVFSDADSYSLAKYFAVGFRHVHAFILHNGFYNLFDPSLCIEIGFAIFATKNAWHNFAQVS